jgi:hypothetical protein
MTNLLAMLKSREIQWLAEAGQSEREIAEALGVSRGAVRRHLGRTNQTGPKRPPGRNAEETGLVEHVGRLVDPVAWLPGGWKHLPQGRPEAQGTLPDGRLRSDRQVPQDKVPGWEVQEQLQPARLALARAVRHRDPRLAMIVRTSSARPRHAPPPRTALAALHAPPPDIQARRRGLEAHPLRAPSGNMARPTGIRGDKPTPVSTSKG